MSLGDRVRFKGKRGTIRYVGPVSSDKTGRTWLGVEWDVVGDGIHDGSVRDEATNELVRYFTTEPGRGSFIKPDKAEFALDFIKALEERYVLNHKVEDTLVVGQAFLDGRALSRTGVVGLEGTNVGCPGAKFQHEAPRHDYIKRLDLSDTLFMSWADVFYIAQLLPGLEELVASKNKQLNVLQQSLIQELAAPKRLRNLVLNECGSDVLAKILTVADLSNITDLHLAKCDLSSLPSSLPMYLKVLDLSYNNVNSIGDTFIAALPSGLNSLSLSGNPLSVGSGLAMQHVGLKKLGVDETCIQSWTEIEALSDIFPSLTDIRVWSCPLTDGLLMHGTIESEIRAKIIVRISRIFILNGATVTEDEKREAEMLMLRRGEIFPRRAVLAELHNFEQPKPTNGIRRILVTFEHKGTLIERRLPVSTSLPNLFSVYARLFAVDQGYVNCEKFVIESESSVINLELDGKLTLKDLLSETATKCTIRQET